MNKILFVHSGRNGNTGWPKVTQHYALALDKAGYDVVVRNIMLNDSGNKVHPRILELEDKVSEGSDIIIQAVLPHHYEYSGHFRKNIGVFFSETDKIPTEWTQRLNLMDELWVPNSSMIEAAKNSGVYKPLKVVCPPIDTDKYAQSYEPLKQVKDKLAGSFSFLFCADLQRRKNLAAVLRAFHTEFSTNEPVELIIKASKFGHNENQVSELIGKMTNDTKINLKLYPDIKFYKQEIIISEILTDEDMCRLFSSCDCLVAPSFGEAWGSNIIDAMGLGLVVIANKVGAGQDYLKGFNEWADDWRELGLDNANSFTLTNGCEDSVTGMLDGFPFLFTADENWNHVSTTELRKRMREVYELKKEEKEKIRKNALESVYEFGYDNFIESVRTSL